MSACLAPRHDDYVVYTRYGCRCPKAREDWRLYKKRGREGRREPRLISGIGSARRLQALVADGWSWRALSERSGYTRQTVRDIATGRYATVALATVAWVRELYAELAGTPGDSTLATVIAKRHGWIPPDAWDDDAIDNPEASPNVIVSVDVDEVKILRALDGDGVVTLTGAERIAAVLTGRSRGMTANAIATALHMSGDRVKEILASG